MGEGGPGGSGVSFLWRTCGRRNGRRTNSGLTGRVPELAMAPEVFTSFASNLSLVRPGYSPSVLTQVL